MFDAKYSMAYFNFQCFDSLLPHYLALATTHLVLNYCNKTVYITLTPCYLALVAAINARDLDKFLKSIGRQPAYVDLEVCLKFPFHGLTVMELFLG